MGVRGAPPSQFTGVPQLPLLLLVFLLVTEALTRAVMEDERIEGGKQGGGAPHHPVCRRH